MDKLNSVLKDANFDNESVFGTLSGRTTPSTFGDAVLSYGYTQLLGKLVSYKTQPIRRHDVHISKYIAENEQDKIEFYKAKISEKNHDVMKDVYCKAMVSSCLERFFDNITNYNGDCHITLASDGANSINAFMASRLSGQRMYVMDLGKINNIVSKIPQFEKEQLVLPVYNALGMSMAASAYIAENEQYLSQVISKVSRKHGVLVRSEHIGAPMMLALAFVMQVFDNSDVLICADALIVRAHNGQNVAENPNDICTTLQIENPLEELDDGTKIGEFHTKIDQETGDIMAVVTVETVSKLKSLVVEQVQQLGQMPVAHANIAKLAYYADLSSQGVQSMKGLLVQFANIPFDYNSTKGYYMDHHDIPKVPSWDRKSFATAMYYSSQEMFKDIRAFVTVVTTVLRKTMRKIRREFARNRGNADEIAEFKPYTDWVRNMHAIEIDNDVFLKSKELQELDHNSDPGSGGEEEHDGDPA